MTTAAEVYRGGCGGGGGGGRVGEKVLGGPLARRRCRYIHNSGDVAVTARTL